MYELKGQNYLIELPSDWECESGEVVSIFRPDGCGVIQISEYTKASTIEAKDLDEFARGEIEKGTQLSAIMVGSFKGQTTAFCVDDIFWQHWYLAHKSILLYVTYNCTLADKGAELDEAKTLLNTLRSN